MSVASEDLVGTEVGRYRLEKLLGEGGMGRVYLGVDVELGTRVAIKVLSKQTPDLVKRFFAEARAVSLISHFNIVNLVDLSELPDGRPYMVMELVEGDSLRDAAPTMKIAVLGALVVEVLEALEAAHAIGIIHRDLKPDNIMVTRTGHAKVLDFGIAKLTAGVGGGLTPRTKEGITMGTPAYMAPEQVTGSTVDARTDIYTMGVVLFEAVTGQRPFSGGTDLDVMRAHRDRSPPRPRTLRPALPAPVEEVILRALAKEPAKRFQSAKAMAVALADAVAGRASAREVASSDMATPRERPAQPASPPARWPALLGVAAIAVAATVVFTIARSRRNSARHAPPADAALIEPVEPVEIDAATPEPVVVDAPDAPLSDAAPFDAVAADAALADVKPTKATLPAPITRAADYSNEFDPISYVARATELARQLAADAQLVEMFAGPVTPADVVPLERVKRRVEYTFVSATGAKADPINGARPCIVVVSIAPGGATARVVTDKRCTQKPVHAPRCSIAKLRERVENAYAAEPDGKVDVTISWRGVWTVFGKVNISGDDARLELPDC